MKDVIYLLMYYWADFETHNDVLGVYKTKSLAEKAAEEYRNSHSLYIDPDGELCVEKALLNRFVWEQEEDNNGNISRG